MTNSFATKDRIQQIMTNSFATKDLHDKPNLSGKLFSMMISTFRCENN